MALAALFLGNYALLSQENEAEKSNLSLDRQKLLFPGEKRHRALLLSIQQNFTFSGNSEPQLLQIIFFCLSLLLKYYPTLYPHILCSKHTNNVDKQILANTWWH